VKAHWRIYIVVVSVLLHLLVLFFWEDVLNSRWVRLNLQPDDIIPQSPLVFDLQSSELPKQVIETAKQTKSETPPKQAQLLSDKDSLAKNETSPSKPLPIGDAYVQGKYKSYEQNSQPQQLDSLPKQSLPQPQNSQDQQITEKSLNLFKPNDTSRFLNEYLDKQQQEEDSPASESQSQLKHLNLESKALQNGGLAFNTYNWDFAPYMLELKKRIRRNIFPPHAFTRLGLISGETILRFKIYPNGELKDLKVMVYNGHKSLMETSYTAVDISAPFAPLPMNFPEPYLEVTGKFVYLVNP
jgi:hypothetical protein